MNKNDHLPPRMHGRVSEADLDAAMAKLDLLHERQQRARRVTGKPELKPARLLSLFR